MSAASPATPHQHHHQHHHHYQPPNQHQYHHPQQHVLRPPFAPDTAAPSPSVLLQPTPPQHQPTLLPLAPPAPPPPPPPIVHHAAALTGVPGESPAMQLHGPAGPAFPMGSATLRLLQYTEGLCPTDEQRHNLDYWRSYVREFFVPQGSFHFVLWNPSSREQKTFEVPCDVLPHYFLATYTSGLVACPTSSDGLREYVAGVTPFPDAPPATKFLYAYPSGSVTHVVESARFTFYPLFHDGFQVHKTGVLRASFSPHTRTATGGGGGGGGGNTQLRIEVLDFTVHSHQSLVPVSSLRSRRVEVPVPREVVQAILASAGVGTGGGDDKVKQEGRDAKADVGGAGVKTDGAEVKSETPARPRSARRGAGGAPSSSSSSSPSPTPPQLPSQDFTVSVEQIEAPADHVNEFAIPLQAMRCMEIGESVCQLRDLMDFCIREDVGPIHGLRKLAAQYREMMGQKGGEAVEAGEGRQQYAAFFGPTNEQRPSSLAAHVPSHCGGTGGGQQQHHAGRASHDDEAHHAVDQPAPSEAPPPPRPPPTPRSSSSASQPPSHSPRQPRAKSNGKAGGGGHGKASRGSGKHGDGQANGGGGGGGGGSGSGATMDDERGGGAHAMGGGASSTAAAARRKANGDAAAAAAAAAASGTSGSPPSSSSPSTTTTASTASKRGAPPSSSKPSGTAATGGAGGGRAGGGAGNARATSGGNKRQRAER